MPAGWWQQPLPCTGVLNFCHFGEHPGAGLQAGTDGCQAAREPVVWPCAQLGYPLAGTEQCIALLPAGLLPKKLTSSL